ncbi:GHKL domain-containing protein [Lachnospiraceae bacterium ZAX-1]
MQQKVIINRQESDIRYYMQMEDLNKKHEEFVHNTTHYLKMIGKFAGDNDCNKILNMIKELNKDVESGEMAIYSSNHVLNAILSEKNSEAEKYNIVFDAYVEPGSVLGMVADIDLIAILGNLLDNAIQAASESEGNRWIKIRIFMQEIGGFCIIKIINRFSSQIIIEKEKIVSTKKEKGIHGIGIKSVENMAEKYGGCFHCRVKEDMFEAVLLLSADC